MWLTLKVVEDSMRVPLCANLVAVHSQIKKNSIQALAFSLSWEYVKRSKLVTSLMLQFQKNDQYYVHQTWPYLHLNRRHESL